MTVDNSTGSLPCQRSLSISCSRFVLANWLACNVFSAAINLELFGSGLTRTCALIVVGLFRCVLLCSLSQLRQSYLVYEDYEEELMNTYAHNNRRGPAHRTQYGPDFFDHSFTGELLQ